MKRIGIVTFFQSYNYGVWFQAYATQAFLRGRGYDAQIVNYSNLHDDEKLKMAFKGKNSYMGYLISFAKNILFGGMHYYRKGFKKHLNTFYSLSSEHCTQIENLSDLHYDVLVAGSDQIWNPETTGGTLDPVFLLQFGIADKRISYASSIGSTEISFNEEGTGRIFIYQR